MDQVERLLLNHLQASFPITQRPYQVLAEKVGITEKDAVERVERLRREGLIRRLGAVFNSHRLGYYSTLCAAKVPREKITILANLLEEIPGVTHNYLRTNAFNMWFTLIASSQSKAERIRAELKEKSGVEEIYSLPATRLFKINVKFDLMKHSEKKESCVPSNVACEYTSFGKNMSHGSNSVRKLSLEEIELVKYLQGDLPKGLTPYAKLAEFLSWSEDILLERIGILQRDGVIRRIGAMIRHRRAGFTVNAMGVWQVPEKQVEEVGLFMSKLREISHCYQRPTLPNWPYNIFSMIHGRSLDECIRVAQHIIKTTGIEKYDMLFSISELKKSSMKYF